MIITLCGSTRFKSDFESWNRRLTMMGHVVITLAMFGRTEGQEQEKPDAPTVSDDDKRKLDLVHLKKIDASEAIFVIDVEGYVGDSTKREIAWAQLQGKKVYYMTDYAQFLSAKREGTRVTDHELYMKSPWR